MKRVLVPVAEGFEEMELTSVVDILRRAELEVVTAGMPSTNLSGSRGMRMAADTKFDDTKTEEYDCIVLVGGNPGYQNLSKSNKLMDTIKSFDQEGKLIAAICAAPSILAKAGIMDDRRATIYPGMERYIPRPRGGRLVVDDHIVTSQGPGTAIEFSLKLVELLVGPETSRELARELVYQS